MMTSKLWTLTVVAGLAVLSAVTVLAGHYAASSVEAQTTRQLQSEVDDLNGILYLSYAQWVAQYETLRNRPALDWMDWSEDNCSVPNILSLGHADDFLMGCLRHDLMWRTMAVTDRATGRVWNERNRLRADRTFLSDHQTYCNTSFADRRLRRFACNRAATAYYGGVRDWAGYRRNELPDERASVYETDHALYHRGITLWASSGCSPSISGNRCLPIHYLEYRNRPFSPGSLGIIPTGTVLKMNVVRANLTSVEGGPDPVNPDKLLVVSQSWKGRDRSDGVWFWHRRC